jgi:hypothetical protein
MARLYRRAGRLTAKNGGFRPGQRNAAGRATAQGATRARGGGAEVALDPAPADLARDRAAPARGPAAPAAGAAGAAAAAVAVAAAAVGAADSVALLMGKCWLVQRWSLKASWFVARMSLNYEKLAETVQPGSAFGHGPCYGCEQNILGSTVEYKKCPIFSKKQSRQFC